MGFILATLAMGCELFGFPPLETERRPVARGRIDDLSFAADRAARTVDLAASFSDPDGDALSFEAASSNRNVAAVRTAGSTLTITPGIRGSATITVTASDPGGLSAVQRFQVTVGNQPPEPRGAIAALSLTVDASGHAVDVAAYFADPDDDPLTYAAESSDRDVATVHTAGSTLTITPVAQGAATITVTATDSGGLTAAQQFRIMVDNRAPTAQGPIAVPPLAADARTVELASYFSDPDGDRLTYAAESSDRDVATVRTAGSTLTIAPVAQGAATITVTASDPGGLSAVQRFPVTVANQAPVPRGTISGLSLTAGASARTVEVAAYFSDPDGDPLTYAAESSNRNVATVRTAGSTLAITPVARGAATVSARITVTASDPGGLSAVQQFHVSVNNRAPAPRGAISVPTLDAAPHSVDVAANFTDPDRDVLTYAAESSHENVATVRTAGSTVTVAPVARGAATITVTASDPGGLTAKQQFPVTVSNQAPAAQGSIAVPPLAAEARTVEVDSFFFDPEGEALTFAAESSHENVATVRSAGSTLTITPVARGAATITVTATDPEGLGAVQQFPVTVANRAPVPQGAISGLSLAAGASARTIDVAAFFTDPDGDPLTYAAVSSHELIATARAAGSTVTVTPRSRGGTARITVTATDPGRLGAVQQFHVSVNNRAPVPRGAITMPPLATDPRTVDVAAFFTDPDGHALTYDAESSDETVATVRAAGSTLTITPVARGSATITVTATDPGSLTAVQRFPVTVANQAPTAQGSIAVPPLAADARTVELDSFFFDPEGDGLTYEAKSSDETVATARSDGSTLTITPVARGSATITVTATDQGDLSATQQFTVTVKNRPPAAQGSIPAPPPLEPGGAAHAVDVAAYFTDPDGDTLTYEAESSHELVATARAGGSTVSVTPQQGGSATITVTATDQGDLSATQQFTVTVKNRPPAATGSIPAPPPLEPGGAAHAVDVAAYFTDPDGDTLSYEAASSKRTVATVGTSGSTVSVTAQARGTATITVTATDQGNLTATQQFTVTVREASSPQPPQPSGPLELQSLTVTGGGGSMYPAFAAGVRHYAVRCPADTTLRVRAQASRAAATVTLLRADASANQAATGSLDASVAVSGDHDVAIELSDGGATSRYVVHCIPTDFPNIRILKKTAGASDGLLFVLLYPGPYWAILDNHGVPRFHHGEGGRDFRRHADGTYSVNQGGVKLFDRLDAQFDAIPLTQAVGPARNTDVHDFLITPDGNYLFISYDDAVTRKVCEADPSCTEDQRVEKSFRDSVIQKVSPSGTELFLWNSWGHLKLEDCLVNGDGHTAGDYAHLNSLQVVGGGDIMASFRNCNQVLRIDGTTGAVEWQLGGSSPPPDGNTVFLAITGDSSGKNEFCGQHHATLTASGTVVLFDNGVHCQGPRRADRAFSRAVEYRISTSSGQASHLREVLLPDEQGYADSEGGVTVLDNGHWLISWGARRRRRAVFPDKALVVSEFDPNTNQSVFEMNVSAGGEPGWTYRAYRYPESDVEIPLKLP